MGVGVRTERRVIRRTAFTLLRHPAFWAWPVAAWLTVKAAANGYDPTIAVTHYHMPALALVLLGCVPSLFDRRRGASAPEPTFLPKRLLVVLTVAVLAAATALRIWKIWEWPPEGIGFEEFQIAARGNLGPNWARNFIAEYTYPGEHALTAYALSVSFALFGTGFLQMRLPFLAVGILSPFLLYAVCRRLVSWEVSLFAVALFAVSWWQIAASRVADEIFFPMWAELAVLWLIMEFEETGQPWAAFLLAFLSGLLIYEYTSYHLVFFVVCGYLTVRVAWFMVGLLRERSPARWRRFTAAVRTYGAGTIAMLLVWMIIANFQLTRDIGRGMNSWLAGGVGAHAHEGNTLFAELDARPAQLPAFILTKLSIPLRAAYQPIGEDNCRFLALGVQPAFDKATAIALGLGFVLVAATLRRRLHALVLIWALLVVLGAALLPPNPNLHRYYTGLPVFYLLIALAAEVVWRRLRTRAARTALLAVFALAVGYAAVDNLRYLFWRLVPNQTLIATWRWPRTEIIKWIRLHPREDWICIVADDTREIYGNSPLQPEWHWLVDGWNVHVSESADCIPASEPAPGGLYYVFARPDAPFDLEARLREHYPNAEERPPIELPSAKFVARTFYVPPPTS